MKIINPYEGAFSLPWFKGDLHIHSKASDGRASLSEIKKRLRECGFDFGALADHDRYSPADETGRPLLFGNSELRGEEGGDVLALFTEVSPDPKAGVQDIIDGTLQAGGFPILAHPRIGEFGTTKHHWAYPSHQLIGKYRGFRGVEIYTHNVGSGFQTAIDRLDALWISRCSDSGQPVGVWGFATSDAHDLHRISPHVGILAAAKQRDSASLRKAIEAGRFYSLAGSIARFTDLSIRDGVLRVSAENACMLRLFGRQQKEARGDRRQLAIAWGARGHALSLEYAITGTEGFLRAEAADGHGHFIYANPVQIGDGSDRKG